MWIKIKPTVIFDRNAGINKVLIDGINVIKPWGFETADSIGYFYTENWGLRNKILKKKVKLNKNHANLLLRIKMPQGLWELDLDEKVQNSKIIRKHTLKTLEDSWFLDYVSRFRFKKNIFNKATIAGKTIIHEDKDLYHQYKTKQVLMQSPNFRTYITIKKIFMTKKFSTHMYVRDSPNEWIIHARLLPNKADTTVLKISHKLLDRAIPKFISEPLFSIKTIRDYFLYRSELKDRKSRLSAYPLVKIDKGKKIEILSEVVFEERS